MSVTNVCLRQVSMSDYFAIIQSKYDQKKELAIDNLIGMLTNKLSLIFPWRGNRQHNKDKHEKTKKKKKKKKEIVFLFSTCNRRFFFY